MLPSTGGKVFYDGKNIAGLTVSTIAARGLVRTFQLPTLFSSFTVLKNVLVGLHLQAEVGFWRSLFPSVKTKQIEGQVRARALEILQVVGLTDRKDELASNLPHGHRRLLQIAVSLGCEPRLLLLDEPFTGMNVEEIKGMMELIKELREKRGITFVMVEHNMSVVMDLCDRIGVLNFGEKIAEGAPAEISRHEGVIRAYLGEAS